MSRHFLLFLSLSLFTLSTHASFLPDHSCEGKELLDPYAKTVVTFDQERDCEWAIEYILRGHWRYCKNGVLFDLEDNEVLEVFNSRKACEETVKEAVEAYEAQFN